MASLSPHPDPQLVEMFRSVRQDSRADPVPVDTADPLTILFTFDGAGLLPIVGDTVVLPLGNISATITGASIVADNVGSAAIDIQLGTLGTWPAATPIYSTIPTLSGAAVAVLDVSLWKPRLQPNDVLIATLKAVSSTVGPPGTFTPSLTTLTLGLTCRRMKWPAGALGVTDAGGNTLTTAGGVLLGVRTG